MSIEMTDAVRAVRRLNPHPESFSRARWVPQSNRFEFPIFYEKLTDELIEQHVEGKKVLGAVGADEHGGTSVVGLDVDAHHDGQKPGEAAKKFVAYAKAMDIPVVVHTSKSGKGLHVRTLFKKHIPSFLARSLYMAILCASKLNNDSSVDKVWPPPTGRGVLAMPYQLNFAKTCGGGLAIDPNTFTPYKRAQQFDAVLEATEMEEEDVVGVLDAFGMHTEREQLAAAGVPKGLDPRKTYVASETQDGLVELFQNCAAVEYVIRELAGSTLHRNFWWGMMTNFKPFRDGRRLYDEISQLDVRRYNKKVFDRQWESVKGKPKLCENLDPGWVCPKRRECTAKAPAGLGARLARMARQEKNQKSLAS